MIFRPVVDQLSKLDVAGSSPGLPAVSRAGCASQRPPGHTYDPADFGIDLEALRARFRFYTERFGVGWREDGMTQGGTR